MGSLSFENKAKIACAYGGMIWGVFWLPLRALDLAGITGSWATATFFVLPLIILAPVIMYRWRYLVRGGIRLHLIGVFSGIAMVLYSDAFLYTEVVRAMLLFYLTPIWGTLLARIFLKEEITPVRSLAIFTGFAGMMVIFGIDLGFPWPKNIGDWMGLASGFVWAIGMVLMRDDEGSSAVEITTVYFLWGSVAAVVALFIPLSTAITTPDMGMLIETLPWLIPVMVIVVMPGVFAVMWGTPHLNPGVAGLLYMTEISVGAASAAIWADEPFGMREIIGIILITLAGLMEVFVPPLARRFLPNRA
ncbi:MAG: DMT family transporter [Rhodospirillaceae bacterium]|nr:DMT family transporter [Rhodospirillaceae bacterium]MBL6931736.1 DMT family transporter [Rhodospirillales bacterium]